MGLNICGEGETVGSSQGSDGQRTSSLKFWSADRKSLIRAGSGYWKYEPGDQPEQKVRFVTGYDYTVRFGALGQVFDRLVFRPLIGWATAWSFDRLRLWIEKGIEPEESLRRSLAYLTARLALAFVWLYQGIVPKLIFRHPDELRLLRLGNLSAQAALALLISIGWIEVITGLTLLLAWHSRWPLWLTLVAMPVAVLVVAVESRGFLSAPFNPVAMNLSILALAAVCLWSANDLPSASACVRKPLREQA